MCKNLFEYNTQYRKKIRKYIFPRESTYILCQKYWGSTFKLGNEYWGSTFGQEVLLGCCKVNKHQVLRFKVIFIIAIRMFSSKKI